MAERILMLSVSIVPAHMLENSPRPSSTDCRVTDAEVYAASNLQQELSQWTVEHSSFRQFSAVCTQTKYLIGTRY